MLGKITVSPIDNLRVHTCAAPEKRRRVNSHIVQAQLVVLDTPYTG
jgi:hypothetical protein